MFSVEIKWSVSFLVSWGVNHIYKFIEEKIWFHVITEVIGDTNGVSMSVYFTCD